MAWYTDEQYDMIQDSREKKSIAASARKQRTHCGKGGSVKFPSDYLSKKELKAMNGECIKYASLKKPMTWEEFKVLPDDLKAEYVKSLRTKFNVPDNELANMFGTGKDTVYRHFRCYGLCKGTGSGAKAKTWNREGWLLWLNGVDPDAVKPSETPVEEVTDEVVNETPIVEERTDKVVDETPVEEETVEVVNETPVEEETVEVVNETDEDSLVAVNENADIVVNEETTTVPEQKGTDVQEIKMFDRHEPDLVPSYHTPVIPKKGNMTFEYNNADDALDTIKYLLSNSKVNLTISWECVS